MEHPRRNGASEVLFKRFRGKVLKIRPKPNGPLCRPRGQFSTPLTAILDVYSLGSE